MHNSSPPIDPQGSSQAATTSCNPVWLFAPGRSSMTRLTMTPGREVVSHPPALGVLRLDS